MKHQSSNLEFPGKVFQALPYKKQWPPSLILKIKLLNVFCGEDFFNFIILSVTTSPLIIWFNWLSFIFLLFLGWSQASLYCFGSLWFQEEQESWCQACHKLFTFKESLENNPCTSPCCCKTQTRCHQIQACQGFCRMYFVWICYERTWQYTTGECHPGMETCIHHVKYVFLVEIAILFTAAIKQTVEDTTGSAQSWKVLEFSLTLNAVGHSKAIALHRLWYS